MYHVLLVSQNTMSGTILIENTEQWKPQKAGNPTLYFISPALTAFVKKEQERDVLPGVRKCCGTTQIWLFHLYNLNSGVFVPSAKNKVLIIQGVKK